MTDKNNWNDVIFFDIEVYPNYAFLVYIENINKDKHTIIDLTDRDSFEQFLAIKKYKFSWNGYRYDNYILDIVAKEYNDSGKCSYEDIYKLSQKLINSTTDESCFCVDGDYTYKDLPRFTDYYDKATGYVTGLKTIASRFDIDVPDSPVGFDECVNDREKELVENYCVEDVRIMLKVWEHKQDHIDSKIYLCDTYNLKHPYYRDPAICKKIFERFLIETNDSIETEKQTEEEIFQNIKWNPAIKFEDENIREAFMEARGKQKTIYIGDHSVTVSSGGLHSTVDERVVGHDLVDVDVSSYYPFLIMELGIIPRQMSPEFVTHLREITETRLKAKAEGNNVVANALKIVINSFFGIMGETFRGVNGKFYDREAFLSVTLNGQLSLLDLAEKLSKHGELVAINTDGITLKPKSMKNIIKTKCDWENRNNFNLELVKYKHIYMRDINNYFAVTEDDTIKAKGSYGTADSRIKAVNEGIKYFAKIGICRENQELVRNYMKTLDVRLFKKLFSFVNDAGKREKGEFYYTTDGRTLTTVDKNGRTNNVAKADSVSETPDNLDYDRYFAEVYDLCAIFFDNKEFVDKFSCDGLIDMEGKWSPKKKNKEGIYVGGYNAKSLPKGIKPTKPETWAYNRYAEGYGFMCHPKSKFVCIDVDQPEKLTPKMKNLLKSLEDQGHFTITSNHPTKFSLIFKVRDDQLNVATKRLKNGYEVLYNKAKKIYGRHSIEGNDHYKIKGELKELPESIYKIFKKKRVVKKDKPKDPSKDLLELLVEFGFVDVEVRDGKILCNHQKNLDIYGDEYHKKLLVFENENKNITLTSFHESAKTLTDDLQNEFNEWVSNIPEKEADPIEIKNFVDIKPNEDDSDVLKYILDNEGFVAYAASTGHGKTYNAAIHAVRRSDELNLSTIIALPTKQSIKEFSNILTGLGLSEGKIKTLTKETPDDLAIHDGDVVVMVNTYLYRREGSKFIYSRIKKLQHLTTPVLYIDEFHLYCQGLLTEIEIDRGFSGNVGSVDLYKSKNKYTTIDNIKKIKGELYRPGIDISINNYGNFVISGNYKIHPNEQNHKLRNIVMDRIKDVEPTYYDQYGLKVSIIDDSYSTPTIRDSIQTMYDNNHEETKLGDECGIGTEEYSEKIYDVVTDIVGWCRLPMVHQNYIPIKLKEMVDGRWEYTDQTIRFEAEDDIKDIEQMEMENDPKSFKYCTAYDDINVKTFIGMDFLPIRHLQLLIRDLNWKIVGTSATPTENQKAILDYLGVDLKVFENKYEGNILDNLTVIKIIYNDGENNYRNVVDNNICPECNIQKNLYESLFRKCLIFITTKNKFQKLKDSGVDISKDHILFYNEGDVITTLEATEKGVWDSNKPIITYSKSSLGTGQNMYSRDGVIINEKFRINPKGIAQPLFKKYETLEEMVQVEGDAQVIQNIGRITRIAKVNGIKDKFVILNNVDICTDFLKEHTKVLKEYKIYHDQDLNNTSYNALLGLLTSIINGNKEVGEYGLINDKSNRIKIAQGILNKDKATLKSIFKKNSEIGKFLRWRTNEFFEGYDGLRESLKDKFWIFCLYCINHTTTEAKRIVYKKRNQQKKLMKELEEILDEKEINIRNVEILKKRGWDMARIERHLQI